MAHDWTSADNDHGESLVLPETTSRCITGSVTATHNFEVASYPLLEGMGVGKCVSSSNFSAGGHDWCIRFFPDGVTEHCAGNASVYLCYLGQANHVRAKFTLTMLEKQGKVQVTDKGRQEHEFSRVHPDWGFPKFVEKSRLLEPSSSSLLDGGSGYLTIRLCKSIDVETVTTTYVLANQHDCEHLKNSCLEFISSSPEVTDAVVESEGFKHVLASCSLVEKRRGNKVAQK
ncbi:hypothetical protein ACQ4PT_041365 [Festuca glaucescens]